MAILNTEDLPKQTNRTIPKGTYTFLVSKFEEKQDKNNNTFLNLQAELIDSNIQGRFLIFDRFYIAHASSPQAVQIGKARLRSFLEACGFRGPFDTENDPPNFVDTEFMADVKIGTDMNSEPQNQFAKFYEKAAAKDILMKAIQQDVPALIDAAKQMLKSKESANHTPGLEKNGLDNIPF